MAYNLHSKFDIELHKKHFKDYLEVIILKNGDVEYAVPSHQVKLTQIATGKHTLSYTEMWNEVPADRQFDALEWALETTEAIPVWNDFIIGSPNTAQFETLKRLHEAGLYTGALKPKRFDY